MSRVIKFRVWNSQPGYEGWLEYRGGFAVNLDGVLCCATSDKRLSPASDYFKIMQFTGLLDKNGKEIYEGDIVKQQHVYSDAQTGQVWYRAELGSSVGWMCGGVYMSSMMESLEVIGNIYEPPTPE